MSCGGEPGSPFWLSEVDHVAVAKHDVIRARTTINRLVEVVAHRVVIGKLLEVRSIAFLDVVENPLQSNLRRSS